MVSSGNNITKVTSGNIIIKVTPGNNITVVTTQYFKTVSKVAAACQLVLQQKQ